MEQEKCPHCGSEELGRGLITGYAKMVPGRRLLSSGSDVLADLCTECGMILRLRVAQPKKFKGTWPKQEK